MTRGRLLLSRAIGREHARAIAGCGSLAEGVGALAGSAYGERVQAGSSLVAAEFGVAETLLWHLQILAGWLPAAGAGLVRVLAYERFRDDHPIIRASETFPEAEVPEGHETYVRLEDCIECGLCLSACPVAATACDYVGPAALSAAERLLEEPRGTDRDDVLAWAGREDGAWRCHVAMECTRACPAEALPAERIMALRRELTFGRRRGERSGGHHRDREAAK